MRVSEQASVLLFSLLYRVRLLDTVLAGQRCCPRKYRYLYWTKPNPYLRYSPACYFSGITDLTFLLSVVVCACCDSLYRQPSLLQ